MTIATPPLRQTQVAAVGSRKRFSATRAFNASVLLRIKFNPDWSEGLVSGVAAAAATVEVDATDLILEVDASSDRSVTFTAKTIATVLDEINATQGAGTSRPTNRWRAGLADVGPSVVDVPDVAAAANAMLGYEDGLAILDSVINAVYVGIGTDRSNRGAGYFLPDGFNTLYDYPLTRLTGGLADPLTSQVGRAGGVSASQGEDVLSQRRSAFRKSPAALAQERHPSASRFITTIDTILNAGMVTTGTLLTYSIAEIDGVVKWSTTVAETVQEIDVPRVECRGPAFITVAEPAATAITAGTVTVLGDQRVA